MDLAPSRRVMKALLKPFCALLIVLAAPAWADVSRDEAAAAAQRVSSGRVLSVEKTESERRPVWRGGEPYHQGGAGGGLAGARSAGGGFGRVGARRPPARA